MGSVSIQFPAVAAFVRHHTHDIRNYLSGFDLEAALLAEIITDPEGMASVRRLRQQIHALATDLKDLSGKFAGNAASRVPLPARALYFIWQDQAANLGLNSVDWGDAPGEEEVDVDMMAVGSVLRELLVNAMHFTGTIGLTATAGLREDRVEFELQEQKTEPLDPSSWGAQPFVSTKRGGYGLGLWQAAQTISANDGKIIRTVLPNRTLVTKLSFPSA